MFDAQAWYSKFLGMHAALLDLQRTAVATGASKATLRYFEASVGRSEIALQTCFLLIQVGPAAFSVQLNLLLLAAANLLCEQRYVEAVGCENTGVVEANTLLNYIIGILPSDVVQAALRLA